MLGRRLWHLGPLLGDPVAVLDHEAAQSWILASSTLGQLCQGVHRPFHAVDFRRRHTLDLGIGNPAGPHMPTMTAFKHYVRGHAMPNGELAHIAVLQVAHALVPVAAAQAAEIRPGDKRLLAGHLDLRLKSERLVAGIVRGRPPPVDQEDGN